MNPDPGRKSPESPILVFESVAKSYRHADGPVPVLANVSFSVRSRETYGLIGESGSGKTTIARLAAGFFAPDAGTITVAGERPAVFDPILRRAVHPHKRFFRTVQLVFQDTFGTLNPYRTIRDNLREPLLNLGIGKRDHDRRIRDILDQVSFPAGKLSARPNSLSGGLRQRIVLARALLIQPDLLILDEPVANLDVSVQAKILNLLKDLKDRLPLTYLLISHDIDVIGYLSDTIGVLSGGRIVEQGSVIGMMTAARTEHGRGLLSAAPHRFPWLKEDV